MPPDDAAAAGDEMTIEELAHQAQVATTTVRMYQSRGLLPGPRRDGRVGRYGGGHLARLRLINQLQARGFSLAAIKQVVDTWESGRSLDDLLGFERNLPGLGLVASSRELQVLAAEQLVARFPDGALTPEVLERAHRMGLVESRDDGRLAVSRTFLDVGAELAAMGVPTRRLLDEQQALEQLMDVVAGRSVAVFREHLWGLSRGDGMSDERVADAAELLARLGDLALRVVDESLRAALRRAATDVVAEEARRVTDPR
ncbi:MAG: MerR family transcriptional regulator [Acidimicrobiales bacterium]